MGAGTLLDLLRERPRTRAELLEISGLSRAALTQRLDMLVERGLVRTEARKASTRGRPAALLSFNARSGALLVADVDRTARLAVTDLAGTILAERSESVDLTAGHEVVVDWLVDRFGQLQEEAAVSATETRAAVVGFPAPVHFATGSLAESTAIPGWDSFPLADAIQQRLRIRVLVDNDVNLITLGEHRTAWADTDDVVFVKIGQGIGAGILAGGQIQRGAQGSAGDIGHIRVDGYGDLPCYCGGTGCLSTVASGLAMAQRLSEAGVELSSIDDIAGHVRAGVPDAIRIVRDAGRATGSVLGGIVNLLNPAAIILGGELAAVADQLLAGIREQIYALATAHTTRELRITISQAGPRAGIIGASALAIAELLSPGAIDRMIGSGAPTLT